MYVIDITDYEEALELRDDLLTKLANDQTLTMDQRDQMLCDIEDLEERANELR
jgi:hypothetical protein